MKPVKVIALMVVVLVITILLVIPSCQHDLVYNTPIIPIDTNHNPIDTVPLDTLHCDTCAAGVISFTEDVLPILQSNCAQTGCHDAITHKDGLNTTSYATLMAGSHKPTSLTGSFFESLTATGSDAMPPLPSAPLTAAQIQIIQTWIQLGHQNTTCTHICTCDTVNVSFASSINPAIQTFCKGCHQASNAQGGVDLTGYANVLAQVNNSKLMKTIKHEIGPGIVAMPYNAAKLNDCTISKFQSWVNAGAPNN